MTPKQERFCAEYLVDLNATQAAIRAGYSPHTAKQQGSLLLTKIDVKQALAAKQGKQLQRLERTAADISRVAWSIAEDEEAPPSARIAALALESKRYREYSEKQDIEARVGVMLVRQTRGLAK